MEKIFYKIGTEKVSASEIKVALYQTCGLVRTAAAILGITPQALHWRIKKSEDLQKTLGDARELLVDKAEESLTSCIEKEQSWATLYVLKTFGRKRGWVERTDSRIEHTGPDGSPIEIFTKINISYDD